MNYSVTVVVPTYNRASSFLPEALQSALNQIYQNFQIIIFDNCSKDDTKGVVHSFRDNRIEYYRHSQNIGMQRNWRFALTYPQTEYVALLEDDNIWMPNHLELAMESLNSHTNAVFFASAAEYFGGIEGFVHRPYWCASLENVAYLQPQDGFACWLRGTPVAASTMVIKRSSLKGIFWGGEDWPWSMDQLWWGQLAMRGDYCLHPEVQIKYRIHGARITTDFSGTQRGAAELRYTLRTLANMALERGLITGEALLKEALQWDIASLSNLVVALSDPSTSPILRKVAKTLFFLREEDLTNSSTSRHLKIAGRIGAWYLRYADSLSRQIAGWHPVGP